MKKEAKTFVNWLRALASGWGGLNAALVGADRPEDMNVLSCKLHRLRGERARFWAVTVRANWRIVFRIENGSALDIDLVDYH